VLGRALFVLASVGLLLAGVDAAAQTARPSSVRITVWDGTQLPVPGAAVTLTSADGATLAASTNERGQAVFVNVPSGLYGGRVWMPGFEPLEMELSVRPGAEVRREVRLELAGIAEELEVAPAAEDDRLIDPFASMLTPEQIASLPEDPEELVAYLQQLVGDDVDVRVDGFSATLPPGAVVDEVRIRYDVGAGGDGRPRVEIRTRPGGNGWRNNGSLQVRDESLNARNAFSQQRPDGVTRRFAWNLSGPLKRNRTGLEVSLARDESLEQQAIRAATPAGLVSRLVEQPETGFGFSARLDHALNDAHSVRIDVRRHSDRAQNRGLGEFDLPERAFLEQGTRTDLRASHRAAFRRGLVNQVRIEVEAESAERVSRSDELTLRVLDAFTSGGAQMDGGRRTTAVEIEDELEFTVASRHQVTVGVGINGSHVGGNERRNAMGTFTFPSLEAFDAGRPTTFTQRLGDPAFDYALYRFAWYAQDDWKLHPSLMVNLGLRHDVQTHLKDATNLAPRVGFNWVPSKERRTAIRGSAGLFYEAFEAGLYEETVVANGIRQADLVIADPTFPDPFEGGIEQATAPRNIVRTAPTLRMPSTTRLSIGVDHPIGRTLRLRATYARRVGRDRFRSRDVNAPAAGVRPDPAVGAITELSASGRSFEQSLELRTSIDYRPRRLSGQVRYRLGEAFDETDGALTLPPDSFQLAGEWGPSRQDIRHRFDASLATDLWAGFRVNGRFRVGSGAPYTITTGEDPNGDGVSNERPVGVGRHSARGAWTRNLDVDLAWTRGLGRRPANADATGSRQRSRRGGESDSSMVRFEIYSRVSNALNAVNPQRYSGVLTSPFFGRPTSAGAARRFQFGMRVGF
jgi:hypothetical protein